MEMATAPPRKISGPFIPRGRKARDRRETSGRSVDGMAVLVGVFSAKAIPPPSAPASRANEEAITFCRTEAELARDRCAKADAFSHAAHRNARRGASVEEDGWPACWIARSPRCLRRAAV